MFGSPALKSGKGAAGHWTDAASNEHGDLLDLIALNRGLTSVRDAMDEARAFSQPAPARSLLPLPSSIIAGAARLGGSGAPSVRHVTADRRHAGRRLSQASRH